MVMSPFFKSYSYWQRCVLLAAVPKHGHTMVVGLQCGLLRCCRSLMLHCLCQPHALHTQLAPAVVILHTLHMLHPAAILPAYQNKQRA
jgi:hypothetical protein